MNVPAVSPDGPAPRRPWLTRWSGLAGGAALALVDTLGLRAVGLSLTIGERDATALVAACFASSLATLGFVVGWLAETRRREHASTTALGATRTRLAQAEKLAALGQLATQIAHEVRNPLAVIRSAAQDLGDGGRAGAAGAARSADFIVEEVDRLSHVVTALLAFARPLDVTPRPVPVPTLVDRALDLARERLATAGVRLVRDVPPRLPAVRVDPDLVCQVLLDLLANASEAAGPGGEVGVEARADGGRVELAVTDSGPGVAVGLRERIFEPFFTTRAQGTGLGLAVARQIVEAHGGRIAVGDRPGGGARFSVWVPA